MERRVLIAIFLAFLVLYVWQAVFVPPPPPRTDPSDTPATAALEPPPAPSSPEPVPPPAPVPMATPLVGDTAEREIRVETPDVIAVFTNRGARLKSWRLKHYLDADNGPLELVATELASSHPLPFSLRVDDEGVTTTLNSALYSVTRAPEARVGEMSPREVIFEYADSAGVRALKEFQLEPATYVIGFRAVVTQEDRELSPAVDWGPAVGNGSRTASRWARASGGLLFTDELLRLYSDDLAEQPVRQGGFGYAGVDDHYFLTAVVAPGTSTVTFQPVSIPAPPGTEEAPRDLVAWSVGGAAVQRPVRFFAGPKDFDVLAAVDRDLVRAIDFGIFAVIVVPLLRSLNWIHGFVGNYGWSIVILTLIINVMMFPLRHKSVVSMRKMQEIQPEAKAIQERYAKLKATDPAKQKMNQELMALYRERGVNPASGCLPMLLTMPVLFAFYSLLTVAIELRGAPFFGWIHDLSQPDPFFVVPILMGATQIWQQRITPTAGVDPAQQKMMMFMPVIFMVFALWFPAGVALYWFVSNLWAIGQQYLTNYLIGPPTVRSVRPPAERRVKRVGAGRTDAASGEN